MFCFKMVGNYFIMWVNLFVMGITLMCSCKAPAQNKQYPEISQKVWDSLSAYPQLTMQSDMYYQLILERYPNTQDAYASRSVAYNKTGDPATGFALLNKAVELAPLENLGYRAFVKLYMMHDYEGALRDCLRLDSMTSNSKPGVWGEDIDMVIGLCHLQLNDLEKARLRFSNSISRVTKETGKEWNSPRVYLYLAITQMKENRHAEAVRTLEELTQLNPNYSEACYYLAQCYISLKATEKARVTIERCRTVFAKYGAEKNPYFELPFQIYPSMVAAQDKS